MSKPTACKQCALPVRRYAKDYVIPQAGGDLVIKRAGRRTGSNWLAANDPEGLFCSMRCAARYGINRAQGRRT